MFKGTALYLTVLFLFSGRNKFSVIFGLGITKFRTGVIKDPEGNPIWNEETVV